jgi:hypothetical protein
MQAWNVYLNGKLIDTVFFSKLTDKWTVWDSLVNHDSYDMHINVRRNNR